MQVPTKAVLGESFYEWLVTQYRPIMGGDANLNVFDIFEQAGFTDLVRRRLQTMWESIPAMGDQIAPIKTVYDRTIEREIAEVASFGVAQFRAPDATPAIYSPQNRYTQEVVSLLLIDEMQRIDEDLQLKLTSPTPDIRARAGVDLVTSATILQLRNENRTEQMRWLAFTGQDIVVQYPHTGQQVTVTYNYTSGHQPSAAVPWTDRNNATPIDDMVAWQRIIANDLGFYGSRFHMNTNTWLTLQRFQSAAWLPDPDRPQRLPADCRRHRVAASGLDAVGRAGRPNRRIADNHRHGCRLPRCECWLQSWFDSDDEVHPRRHRARHCSVCLRG